MRDTEYSVSKINGEIIITALVSPYGFYPEGDQKKWTDYATKLAKSKGWSDVKLFMETQDKETGYSSTHFVCNIV